MPPGHRPNKANTRPSTSPLPTGGRNCSSPANAWPKALARPCRPYCTRPSTPSPHARGVKDTSRDGKYHNKREFVALAGELGLAWPEGQRPHLVIGFSDVQLTEQALPTTPTPSPAWAQRSGCTATPSAAWACSAAKARMVGRLVRTATGSSPPARPASGSRSPAAASRHGRFGSAPSSTPPGPISDGVCGQDFQPQDAGSNKAGSHAGTPMRSQVA
jgi:hypothetical protein